MANKYDTAIKDGINGALLTIVQNRSENGTEPMNLTNDEIGLIEAVVLHYVDLEVKGNG